MINTFFIADTHFGHANILEYESEARPFKTVEEMNDVMIERWNSVVNNKDIVYHLGDFAFGKHNVCIASRLNGKKRLVLGNHDNYSTADYLQYFDKLLCKKLKTADDFYKDNKGLHTYCKECCKIRAKGRYRLNAEKCKSDMKKWRKNNVEINKAIKAKSSFGISREDYFKLKKICVICGSKEKLCIDHSHQTSRIRGMLCSSCNKGLGFFKDNPILLNRASDYILGHATVEIFEMTYEKVSDDL